MLVRSNITLDSYTFENVHNKRVHDMQYTGKTCIQIAAESGKIEAVKAVVVAAGKDILFFKTEVSTSILVK